jgi:hypothetical protein
MLMLKMVVLRIAKILRYAVRKITGNGMLFAPTSHAFRIYPLPKPSLALRWTGQWGFFIACLRDFLQFNPSPSLLIAAQSRLV